MKVRELIEMLQGLPPESQDLPASLWHAGGLQPIVATRDVARHSHGLNPATVQLMTWKPWQEDQAPAPQAAAASLAAPPKGGK